jgi:RHS repeat-associated protein
MGDTRRRKLPVILAILAVAVGFAAPASASFTSLTPAPTTASSLAASVETPMPSLGMRLSRSRTPTGPRPYFGARYYGSKIGRFTTTDPSYTIADNLVDPQRWNRYAYARNNPFKYVDPDGRDVSIALNFTGAGWGAQDRSAVIGRVSAWYGEQGVGNVYVFDAATMDHGAWFASLRAGYADVEVTSASGTKQSPDKVFAGNYAELPGDQRVNAISNAVIHETAAHQFHGTYAESIDQIAYSRGSSLAAADPQVSRRRGTVADSYAYSDEKTRSKVTGGPIPIDPADRRTLVGKVGPSVKVEPPVKK